MKDETKKSTTKSFEKWWASVVGSGLTRVPLLKSLEAATAIEYESTIMSALTDDPILPTLRAVVLESNMAGIEEFSPLW